MKAGARYPLATVFGYGPNHQTATKLVASIFKKPGQKDPAALEKWIVQGGDIRKDPSILDAVQRFIKRHHAVETMTYDRVLGCPHEEGIDYPEGQVCPHCPFWANLDRFTLEPKSLALPLTPEQIVAGLSVVRDRRPWTVYEAVELHREKMTGPFLQLVQEVLDAGAAPRDRAQLFRYALAFLTKWREPRAFPLVVRWLSLPGEGAFDLGDDTVSEWGPRMLAELCGNDIAPIKELILNREANAFCRGVGIEVLGLLAARGECDQSEIADYFAWLAREGLEREPSSAWDSLLFASGDLEATAVVNDLRQAAAEGLLDVKLVKEELDILRENPPGTTIAHCRDRAARFDDIAEETIWWPCFDERLPDFTKPPDRDESPGSGDSAGRTEQESYVAPQPYVAPPKTGRNDPCPCGSGKKYKKCCGT